MELDEAKEKFIQTWGAFGSKWGINRTMAQVHALLLISPEPVSTEDVMEELKISRGNANMNIRELMNWNLVRKELKAGERKEFFVAEKDIWKVAREVAIHRKRTEFDPMVRVLEEIKEVKGDKKDPEFKEFNAQVRELHKLANSMDKTLDKFIRADEHWFFGTLMKMMR